MIKKILCLIFAVLSFAVCFSAMGCDDDWIEDEYYNITFDYNGGEGNEATRKVKYGEKVTDLPVPTKTPEGVDFVGWMDNDSNYFENGTVYSFKKNIKLIAVWSNSFKVTLRNQSGYYYTAWADGTTGEKTVIVFYGRKINLPKIIYDNMSADDKADMDKFPMWVYRDKNGTVKEFSANKAFTFEDLNVDSVDLTIYIKIEQGWTPWV